MRSLFPEKDLLRALAEKVFGPSKQSIGKTEKTDPAIGQSDCWCGRPQNHDWPMKEIGAAHPRYPE